jgi:hypothetical protein
MFIEVLKVENITIYVSKYFVKKLKCSCLGAWFYFCFGTKSNKKIKATEKQLKIFAFRYAEEAKDWAVELK